MKTEVETRKKRNKEERHGNRIKVRWDIKTLLC